MAYVVQYDWNHEQSRVRFSGTRCRRAGTYDHAAQFVCTTRMTDRVTGRVTLWRFAVQPDGGPLWVERTS